jgi:NTE family protein
VNTSVLTCATGNPRDPFRSIDVLWLSPSCGFGKIAAELADHIPGVVRYLMRGLGPDDATSELASYLLFDAVYCSRLMEIGRADVQARRDEILAFFAQAPPSLRRRERSFEGGA